MTPTPTPDPLEVLVHTGPAEWWQILAALGPLAVLLGALLAALIGWHTLRQRTTADAKALAQKREADNRSEWWKRTQWAIDNSLSEEPDKAKLGLRVMTVLAESSLAGPEELKIITSAWQDPLDVAEQTREETTAGVDGTPEPGDNESTTTGER